MLSPCGQGAPPAPPPATRTCCQRQEGGQARRPHRRRPACWRRGPGPGSTGVPSGAPATAEEPSVAYRQAFVIALVQGVTELFPVSSLGHSVLLPAWIGGSWQTMVTQSSQADSGSSFYLAYIVALHCATALALLWFFRADWVRIIRGFFSSIRDRRAETSDPRTARRILLLTHPLRGPPYRPRATPPNPLPPPPPPRAAL